jgi:hypothetical protein
MKKGFVKAPEIEKSPFSEMNGDFSYPFSLSDPNSIAEILYNLFKF